MIIYLYQTKALILWVSPPDICNKKPSVVSLLQANPGIYPSWISDNIPDLKNEPAIPPSYSNKSSYAYLPGYTSNQVRWNVNFWQRHGSDSVTK